jgi:uncharacterized phage-associated protein
MMANVFDVAVYILKKQGDMTAMKLQKLVYYAQAWSVVWDETPLFQEDIEAWVNGPVTPCLYALHRGRFKVDMLSFLDYGNVRNLTRSQRETIDTVLHMYGDKSPEYLSALTHEERPWKEARKGTSLGARGNYVITLEAMKKYYGAIYT